MRRTRFLLALCGLAVTSTVLGSTGCTVDSSALLGGQYPPFAEGTGPVKPNCNGDPLSDPTKINETCAIFVRGDATDNDEGLGTQEAPLKTLQKAIDKATNQWIIVCAKNTFKEALTVLKSGAVSIYGGFDCSRSPWVAPPATAEAKKTSLQAPPDAIAFTVKRDTNVATDAMAADLTLNVSNFAIEASSATMPGGSSIAAMLSDEQTKATFTACTLTAGDAMAGDNGAAAISSTQLTGHDGNKGTDPCAAGTSHAGAKTEPITCPDMSKSFGGDGGSGEVSSATSGKDGSAMPSSTMQSSPDGKGGLGEGATGATMSCTKGNDGHGGDDGNPGAAGTGIGDIGIEIPGYAGTKGLDGDVGKPGLGGGGGGGSKGQTSSSCPPNGPSVAGASGGSGGTGGCGGAGGGGGKAGGSSIALITIGATVTLTATSLTAGAGGNGGSGGKGGDGGLGGSGGNAGPPSSPVLQSCKGGDGGPGGKGGAGGGGQGGHSLAVATKGGVVKGITVMDAKMGTPGMGGPSGDGKTTGDSGKSNNCWDFKNNSDCTP